MPHTGKTCTVLLAGALLLWLRRRRRLPSTKRRLKQKGLEAVLKKEAELKDRFAKAVDASLLNDHEKEAENNARSMSNLMKSGYLSVDAIQEEGMETFFAAHRAFIGFVDKGVGSLAVRFTVQYNLYSGTISALGSEKQVAWLKEAHARGELGSFLLTERGAGVLSGLVVETTATANKDGFILSSPTADSEKVWISQGFTAKWGVVIARLIVDGADVGPQAFIVDMKAPGVKVEDMPLKTAFNSLDNANVKFHDVQLPADALLSRFCNVVDGKFTYEGDRPPSFIRIAQRLLSGRLAISDTAVAYSQSVLEKTQTYTTTREVWVDKDKKAPLSDLPYITRLIEQLKALAGVHRAYLAHVEGEFARAVQKGVEPPRHLQSLIAAAKAECVDFAMQAVNTLRCKVGSFSLMDSSPFGRVNDILYCMRFAEGDTHILQQMITRDVIKPYTNVIRLVGLLCKVGLRSIASCVIGLTVSQELRQLRDRYILSLLLCMKYHSLRMGRMKAWLHMGDDVYRVAKVAGMAMILDTLEKEYGTTYDTDLFACHALTECGKPTPLPTAQH